MSTKTLAQLEHESALLLDRVELPGDNFPFSIDLFQPGPEFEGWRALVLENRRQREELFK